MITLAFCVLLLMLVGKLIALSVKATWGILKIVLTIIFMPAILVFLAIGGLMYIAFPLLIVAGIIAIISPKIL